MSVPGEDGKPLAEVLADGVRLAWVSCGCTACKRGCSVLPCWPAAVLASGCTFRLTCGACVVRRDHLNSVCRAVSDGVRVSK